MNKKHKIMDVNKMKSTLNHSNEQYLKSMDKYVSGLKAMPSEKAQQYAKESLVRSGVITKGGKTRENCK